MRQSVLALAFLPLSATAQTVIDFDDLPGLVPASGFGPNTPAAADRMIDSEYFDLGVLFESGGGGLFRAAPTNPVSPPNCVTATKPGPVISYSVPARATFWFGDRPGVVDFVQVALTDTSFPSELEAYDFEGNLLGRATGGASAVLRVDAPGAIRSVLVQQGPMGFDDFTFDGLAPLSALAVTPLLPGHAGSTSRWIATGATAGEPLLLELALDGSQGPSTSFGLVADAQGEASLSVPIPPYLIGRLVSARVRSVSQVSPWSERVVAPAPDATAPGPLRSLRPGQALRGEAPPR